MATTNLVIDLTQNADMEDVANSELDEVDVEEADASGDHCTICLQEYVDRTIIPDCAHEFCFECIVMWTEQSRRCPLCSQTIGSYLMHNIRSKYDYQKHHLPALRTTPPPLGPSQSQARRSQTRRIRERQWGRRARRAREEADELEKAIDKRRWIYQNYLYAKHVATNQYTRYRPYPTPAQFTASPDHIRRATAFIRRELRVWVNLDVEFLTTFVLSLMKAIDIRTESAVKLLAEFLDMDTTYKEGCRHRNAEHFAHELYCYMRSPYKNLPAYDEAVQYDAPCDSIGPSIRERSYRWQPYERPTERPPSAASKFSNDSAPNRVERLSSHSGKKTIKENLSSRSRNSVSNGRLNGENRDGQGINALPVSLEDPERSDMYSNNVKSKQRKADIAESSSLRLALSRDGTSFSEHDASAMLGLKGKRAELTKQALVENSEHDYGPRIKSRGSADVESAVHHLSKDGDGRLSSHAGASRHHNVPQEEKERRPVKIVRHREVLSNMQAYLTKAAEQRCPKRPISSDEEISFTQMEDYSGETLDEVYTQAEGCLTSETRSSSCFLESSNPKGSVNGLIHDGDRTQDNSLSILHTRSKLMRKLEEERGKVADLNFEVSGISGDNHEASTSAGFSKSTSDTSTIAEARLRTRARVRMKLLAERRSVVPS